MGQKSIFTNLIVARTCFLRQAGHVSTRTALITGGTRGLGFATGLELARNGYRVIAVGSSQQSAQQAVSNAAAQGVAIEAVQCQITVASSVDELAAEILSGNQVDVLINSAGVMSDKTAKTLRTDPAEWGRVMSVNLDATFYFVRAFAPPMVERRDGRIINFSACLGRFSGPGNTGGLAPYRVSKSGVNALTRNMAHELGLGSRGVLVDAVCPGHCRTDMGGPNAPRSAEQGADTAVWLAMRPLVTPDGPAPTGLLWEDRQIVPW